MTPVVQFVLAIMLIVAAAKLAGLAARRLGQPAVLGEVLIGVLLGPSALNLLHLPWMTDVHLGDSLSHLAEIGVILLMFIAGLEVDLQQMRRAGVAVVAAGLLGVAIPLAMGWGIALPFGVGGTEALYLGLLLTATSVSISAQTLLELGVLQTRVGIVLLGAAVVDDIVVILLLSIVLAASAGTGGAMDIVLLLARVLLYLVFSILFGRLLLPRILARVHSWRISEGILAAAVVLALLYAWSAEVLGGVAMITGAFLAGIFMAGSDHRHQIEQGMHALAYGLFVPIFFVNIGLHANIWELQGSLIWLTAAITVTAVVSKVLGAGLGARLGGLSLGDSARVGIGMISRGEVGLIVASLAVSNGLVPGEVLSLAVIMVLVTTIITPPLLRLAFRPQSALAQVRSDAE